MHTFTHAIESLRATITGGVILPGAAEYDEARTVFAKKGEPAVIVRPKTAGDVAAAVRFATANDLVVSVRSGGHSQAGHSTNTGGMVIDVRGLNTVKILDSKQNIVRIGSGAQWGNVAAELAPHNLVIS